jgi:hypothetical protein
MLRTRRAPRTSARPGQKDERRPMAGPRASAELPMRGPADAAERREHPIYDPNQSDFTEPLPATLRLIFGVPR